jgi:hypothetical protein
MTRADVMLVTGTPYLPQVVGGVEVNTHEIATELNRRGCKTAVLAKLSLRDAFGATRILSNYWRGSQICLGGFQHISRIQPTRRRDFAPTAESTHTSFRLSLTRRVTKQAANDGLQPLSIRSPRRGSS